MVIQDKFLDSHGRLFRFKKIKKKEEERLPINKMTTEMKRKICGGNHCIHLCFGSEKSLIRKTATKTCIEKQDLENK